MTFTDLESALEWIESQVKFKPKTDVSRMQKAYDETGLSFDDVLKVHVAGTNGKGSVCQMISAIAESAGLSVGVFTSPYLIRFNERIRIGREEIADKTLLALIEYLYDFNERFFHKHGETLAFFELVTLMALIHFRKQHVDLIVMEVGLGGLLDATNILNYDLSLITNIGFDHMKQLGSTREAIALNKLGILKPGNHLLTTVDNDLGTLFADYAKRVGATMTQIDVSKVKIVREHPHVFEFEGQSYRMNMLGDYQVANAMLARAAIMTLLPEIDQETIAYGIEHATWAGRMERVGQDVYLDAAHNTSAISALIDSLRRLFPGRRLTFLVSFLSGKDIEGMLTRLKEASDRIIMTSFPDRRYVDLGEYAADPIVYAADLTDAYRFALEKKESGVLIITGSIHFIGHVKRTIGSK